MVGTQTGGLQDDYPGHFGFLVLVPAIHFLVTSVIALKSISKKFLDRQNSFHATYGTYNHPTACRRLGWWMV